MSRFPADHPQPDPLPPAPIPLRPVEDDRPRPTALPLPLTSFVGREGELAKVRGLLAADGARLVVLTGPGGVGKTHLALELAAELADGYADGAVLVELAALEDPGLVAATVLRALRSEDGGDRSPADLLRSTIGEREVLLVLDNLEHLLPAAPLLTALLAACPYLTILATSRVRLRLRGEHEVPIAPLGLPDLAALPPVAELPSFGAIRLWSERAQAANPAFALTAANAATVAAICHRLDGLPLAIELAAARSHALSPEAILARLERRLDLLVDGPRDAPARHRTMRAAIAWSHDLLDPAEQALFRRLSVFVGGFTVDAADHLGREIGMERRENELLTLVPRPPTLDLLTSLVGKSLLRPVAASGEPRYAMLETVREFGLERVAASGEEPAIRDAHAAWYVALAERAEPELSGPRQAAWYDRLEAELGNLRAAFAHLRAKGAFEPALRLAEGVEWFWTSRGHYHESRDVFEALLAMPGAADAPATLAMTYVCCANAAHALKDLDHAQRRYDQGLALYRALGDQRGLAIALRGAGSVAVDQGDRTRAEALLQEARAVARASGADWHVAGATHRLGVLAFALGDYDLAIARQEEALTIWRRLGDTEYVATALTHLGLAALAAGCHDRAHEAYREALDLAVQTHDNLNLARSLEGCGGLAAARGDLDRAARLFAAASTLRERSGESRRPPTQAAFDRMTADVRHRLGEAAYSAAWEAGQALSLSEAAAEARSAANRVATAGANAGLSDSSGTHTLTKREAEVLRLLAGRLTDREIAERLFISRRTASKHVEGILAKLGVADRRAAAAEARRRGLA